MLVGFCVRDGSNLSGSRAVTIDRGGENFFLKEIGGANIFSRKIRGTELFFRKKGTFFTTKFENPRFHFSKRAIFEEPKVIYVGSSNSSLLIGV